MPVLIDIQNVSASKRVPDSSRLKQWAQHALAESHPDTELSLRIVDEDEGRQLNKQWRSHDAATNVLSFPVGDKIERAPELLGDIVICAPVVEREAAEQMKNIDSHWAHMLIHGILHLQGLVHEDEVDANKMEACEIRLMKKIGYANPYAQDDQL